MWIRDYSKKSNQLNICAMLTELSVDALTDRIMKLKLLKKGVEIQVYNESTKQHKTVRNETAKTQQANKDGVPSAGWLE